MTMRGGEAAAVGAATGTATTPSADAEKIDEGLYSRQLYVLGHDAMRRMAQANILRVGLGGLGIEVAKDLALAGIKSLALHDPKPCEAFDMSSHFYVGEDCIGKSRAEVSAAQLSDLNPNTKIEVLEGSLGIEDISRYNLVICTDSVFGECVQVDDACRALGIKFIMAQTRGVFGSIFVDLGNDFVVVDDNGENPATNIVSGITNDNPGVVSLLEDVNTPVPKASDPIILKAPDRGCEPKP